MHINETVFGVLICIFALNKSSSEPCIHINESVSGVLICISPFRSPRKSRVYI